MQTFSWVSHYYFYLLSMKSKRAEQPQILDRKGLAALHDNIIEKISVLDKLNE